MKRSSLLLAGVALVFAASSAQAQIVNTGTGLAASDPYWTVRLFDKAAPGTDLYNGAAQRITSIPSVWQVNNSPVANWIGVSRTGSFTRPNGGSGGIGYRYIFTTNLLGMQTIAGSIGWDNNMIGYSFDGGATITQFSPASNFDEFGFCRTSDGEFNDKPQPTCTRDFSIEAAQGAKTFSVIIDGDLTTDGLIIQGAQTTVPEPSTYALMGAGLAALAFVARRRRQTAA